MPLLINSCEFDQLYPAEKQKAGDDHMASTEDKTFHRYYHLYKQGELERDIEAAGGKVVEAGYEKDNWWAIATRDVA